MFAKAQSTLFAFRRERGSPPRSCVLEVGADLHVDHLPTSFASFDMSRTLTELTIRSVATLAFFAASVSACSSGLEPTAPISATAELLASAGGSGGSKARPINDEERTSTAAAASARAADASARRARGMRRAAVAAV